MSQPRCTGAKPELTTSTPSATPDPPSTAVRTPDTAARNARGGKQDREASGKAPAGYDGGKVRGSHRPVTWRSALMIWLGSGRAARHFEVDRDEVAHRPLDPGTSGEDPAVSCAVADGDHDLRLRRRVVCRPKGRAHVARDHAGDQQPVGMPRRRHQPYPVAFRVVDRGEAAGDLDFAAVARSGVDVAQGERPAKTQARRERLRKIGRRLRGLPDAPDPGEHPHVNASGGGGGVGAVLGRESRVSFEVAEHVDLLVQPRGQEAPRHGEQLGQLR